MSSQIRLKKKREAVRRLSQGSGAPGYPRDHRSALSLQAPGQPLHRRKFPGQHETKRQHPGVPGQRPAKRNYVSPLDHNPATSDNAEAKQIKHTETVNFGFVATAASMITPSSQSISQSTIAKPDTSSAVLAKPVFSSGFPASVSNFQQNAVQSSGEASTSIISTASSGFATGFGMSQTNADAFAISSGNVFVQSSQPASSLFGQSQTSNPVSSSGFQSNNSLALGSSSANTSSSILSNLSASVKEPSSSLTFSGFKNLGPSSSAEVSSSSVFGTKSGSETVKISDSTSLTFGALAAPSLQVKSTAVSKPPFAVASPAKSNTFGVAATVKPQTRIFGQSLNAGKGQQLAKENKEKVTEDKLQTVDISLLKTLVIRDIPESYNKNAWLKRFYSQFGMVSKVLCSAVKRSATVTFTTHEGARLAKREGKILRPGLQPVKIFWKQQGRKRTTSESEQPSSPEKIKKISAQTAPSEKQTQQRIKMSQALKDIQEYLKSVPASESAGDKLQVLEGIDKKLRLVFERSSDISSAKAVIGTCKDMCPEKERYMREHQRRLSVFEVVSGTGSFDENPQVNHTRAVKEYDRSAADKEEPLPHELRPVPVLRMTMDYLATNIMDLCEGREGEWFDFLWNRTRGIRKDITQQHLCDPDCVDLVEKTARFHIFCAHFLCEADMNSFDAKINTENLTKCLQTLKQFYGDLLKDKGVTCPQEAEFRAYDILLNLNEGDILREVMTFRDEIQQSPEVRFAMAVFHALNSNNFVRFFRLLRNASYLSACLLHRYFTQVRSKAVQTLNHSLSIPNRTTPFQLKELADILAFENESEADEFCTFHGLTVTEGFVNFARSSFIEPESKLPAKRAWKLIESKRSCSIGEVVYNGPLPTPPQHQPCLSFSEDGRYIGYLTDLHSTLVPTQIEPAKPTVSYSEEEIQNFTKTLFLEVMNEMCADITKEAIDKVHVDLQLSTEITDTIYEETISEFIRETANTVFTEELSKKRIAQENAITRERVSRTIHDDLTEEFVSLESTRIAEEVIREVRLELLKLARERISQEICQSLIEEKISAEVEEIAEEVLQEAKAERDAKLQLLAGYVIKSRTAKYFERWHTAFRASVHLKGLLNTFPPGPPMISIDNQLQQLVGHRTQDVTMAVIRTDAHESEIRNVLEKRQAHMEYSRKQACRPLDVPLLLADSMRSQPVAQRLCPSSPVYWKLILSLPEMRDSLEFTGDHESGLDVCSMIREKLKRGFYPVSDNIPHRLKRKIDLLALYGAEVRGVPLQKRVMKICTKACYGVLTNTEVREAMETRQFFGSHAAIFVVDGKELQRSPEASREAHIRLRRILESKPPEPRLPVAVIVIDHEGNSTTEADMLFRLGVQQLKTDGLLSECNLSTVSSLSGHRDDLSQKLCAAVTWLGRHMARCSLPKTDNVGNFIENGLQRFFTTPLAEDVFVRRQAKLDQQCPEAIVELYNSALEHLGAVASSRRLQNLSWPMKEFSDRENGEHDVPDATWNSYENLQRMNTLITSLKLAPPPPAAVDGTWESESNLCLEYARRLSPDTASLLNRVKWILARTQRALNGIDLPLASPWLSASQVPWPLVLEACVNFRLTPLQWDPGLEEQDVHFLPEELDAFYPPTLWMQSVNLSKKEAAKAKSLESSKPRKSKGTKLQESFLDMEQQFQDITGLSRTLATPSVQSTPVVTSSYLSVPTITPLLVTPPLVTSVPRASSMVKESPCSSSQAEIRIMNEQLKSAVDEAKMQSRRFEELLKNGLSDTENPRELREGSWRKRKAQSLGESKKSPKFVEGMNLPKVDVSFGSLEESLLHINATLKSQRRSDQFTERRLSEYLDS